ncbi:VOC family protein [Rhizorhabdus dicambivorans]|uniref:Lactoylglutathione lyase n=1 Tax=Rhizorhabdus dicambivorans TaxID=1850238 RepID=A0A2A4FUP9_9SPHN|nr:VOC family protein [Rhizorhabdus dicambivorans]ATE67200.1 lactoylglutathione lyase [Rhizorhabdus dicambivorans]PCE42501.1 lactoylglutathione lyase [Rhizorhabdus dicambivorans]
MKFLHTMVRVRDLEESLSFYRDALGLEEMERHEAPAGRFTLVFLAAPQDSEAARAVRSPMIELTHNWDAETYSGGRNFGHIAFAVDDIYATCRRLLDHGVVLHRPPRDGKMAFVRSPDDISVELLQTGAPLQAQEPWASMPNIGSW